MRTILLTLLAALALATGIACDGGIRGYRAYTNPFGFKSALAVTRAGSAGLGGGHSAAFLAAQERMQSEHRRVQMMSNIMQMQHETQMMIINNMGGGGGSTYDHYRDGQYIGTWP